MAEKALFKDPQLQQQFEQDGYVKVQMLTEDDIQKLRAIFFEFHPEVPEGFYSSSYTNGFDFKHAVSERIVEIMMPRLAEVFADFRTFGAAFLSKTKGPYGELPMHQDWTIVDEEEYTAVNVWTPLVDAGADNGTLRLLKGSHDYVFALRAPTLPFYFDGHQELIKENMTCVPTKAGEAIILNQALIHYSPASNSDELRLAITTGVTQKDAPLLFHYREGEESKVERLMQDDTFLLKFENFHEAIYKRPPFGESNGFLENYNPPIFSKEQMAKHIEQAYGEVKFPQAPQPKPQPEPQVEAESQVEAVVESPAEPNGHEGANGAPQAKGFLQRVLAFFK